MRYNFQGQGERMGRNTEIIDYREIAKIQSEEAQQTAFFMWLELCLIHGVKFADSLGKEHAFSDPISDFKLIHHIPNGGERNKVVALKLKNQGVKKGIPDIFFPCARKGFYGLYIEMKKEGGVLSKEQKNIIHQLQMNGYCVRICYTFNEARIALLEYYYGTIEKIV